MRLSTNWDGCCSEGKPHIVSLKEQLAPADEQALKKNFDNTTALTGWYQSVEWVKGTMGSNECPENSVELTDRECAYLTGHGNWIGLGTWNTWQKGCFVIASRRYFGKPSDGVGAANKQGVPICKLRASFDEDSEIAELQFEDLPKTEFVAKAQSLYELMDTKEQEKELESAGASVTTKLIVVGEVFKTLTPLKANVAKATTTLDGREGRENRWHELDATTVATTKGGIDVIGYDVDEVETIFSSIKVDLLKELRAEFGAIDTDNSSSIDLKEFATLIARGGINSSVEIIFKEIDTNNDRRVNF